MALRIRPVVVVPGISIGGNAANAGYSAPLLKSLRALVADRRHTYNFKVVEAPWADEAQDFADLDTLKAAESALAAAWGGPVAVGILKALELFGLPTGASLVDLIADVIAYSGDGCAPIKLAVRRVIEAHPGCVLVGHSMGTVISIDVLTDMIAEGLFKGPRETWPTSALETCGSPLGINVPVLSGIGYLDRARRLARLGTLPPGFIWRDHVDRDDPVASGSIWNDVRHNNLEHFPGYKDLGVNTLDVDTGGLCGSHNGYYENVQVAQVVLGLATRRYF